MALSSGIYTIKTVKNSNWAMLLDGNDEGEVVAGSSASPNVGEKVRNMKLTAKPNQLLPVVHRATGERNLYSTESALRRKLCDSHTPRSHTRQSDGFQHLELKAEAMA